MKCNVVRDLLPVYFDGLCTDETKKQLEEHLEHCESCKRIKKSIEAEQDWIDENKEWNQSIAPLKKIQKKIRKKNLLIAVCTSILLLLVVLVSVLTYGQITKKGISFELLYEAARFRGIGKEFAAGNIEPLYEILATGYILQDAESSVLRLAYTDCATYDADMKEAILEKYQQYFSGKGLTYKGIEEIAYSESPRTGGNRTLYISLKFEGDNQMEYYIALYKTLNGQYWVDDYFGNPYLSYVSELEAEKTETGSETTYHTEDTLFSCLPNTLYDFDLCLSRQVVLTSGRCALQGDTSLAKNGQLQISILSEQDLKDGTYTMRDELNAKLDEQTEEGYFLTDLTWNVKEYDKAQHLYKYQINMELTNATGLDETIVTLDCYRISEQFVYIPGSEKIYDSNS